MKGPENPVAEALELWLESWDGRVLRVLYRGACSEVLTEDDDIPLVKLNEEVGAVLLLKPREVEDDGGFIHYGGPYEELFMGAYIIFPQSFNPLDKDLNVNPPPLAFDSTWEMEAFLEDLSSYSPSWVELRVAGGLLWEDGTVKVFDVANGWINRAEELA